MSTYTPQDSAFGLFARNLEARTDNGELLNLIDGNGCPLNELIFPALQLEGDSRALNADFKVSTTKILSLKVLQIAVDVVFS